MLNSFLDRLAPRQNSPLSEPDITGHFRLQQVLVAFVMFLVGMGVAGYQARKTIEGVTSPNNIDHFRDIASAQAILDGDYPYDPAYRGEFLWFNPMTSAAVALVSYITGLPPEQAHVQAGPYLNSLCIVAFFFMMVVLFGPWPGLLASTAILFSPPYTEEPWVIPTYSAWLYASNLSVLFFSLGLICCKMAAVRRTARWWILTGICLGLTFLTWTAPAIILGLCVTTAVLKPAEPPIPNGKQSGKLMACILFLVTALIVSIPLLCSVLWKYQLRIVNPAPNNWCWSVLMLENLGTLLRSSFNLKNLCIAICVIVVAREFRRHTGCRLALVWMLAALTMFVYGVLQQATDFRVLPPLLPIYHSYFCVQCAGVVFLGVGGWLLVGYGLRLIRNVLGQPTEQRLSLWVAPAFVVLSVTVYTFAVWPQYKCRKDATISKEEALYKSAERRSTDLTPLIRQHTPPGAVILASPERAIFEVLPANRQVLVLSPVFSNPYVDREPGAKAQRELMAGLSALDSENFHSLAEKFHVTHVLLGPEDIARFDARPVGSVPTEELFRKEGFILLRLLGEKVPEKSAG